jgi:hypothetical protein
MLLKKVLLLLLSLALLGGCTPTQIARTYCDSKLTAPPEVEITINVEPYEVHNDKSRVQIGRDLNGSGKAVLEGQAMGATTAAYEQQTMISPGNTVYGPGFVCSAPHIEVNLNVKAPVVDIAAEFEPDSCRFDTVLEHELQHVKAYADHLSVSKVALTAKILEHYRLRPYFFANTPADLQRQVIADTQSWLIPAVSAQLALSSIEQRHIDNPVEYLRLTLSCPQEPLHHYVMPVGPEEDGASVLRDTRTTESGQ